MGGSGPCPCLSTATGLEVFSSAANSRKIRSNGFDPGGSHQKRRKQRRPGHPNFPHMRARKSLPWNGEYGGLGAQQQSTCDELSVSSCITSLTAGYELQSLCDDGQLDKAMEVLLRMDREGFVSSVAMYMSVLSLCTKRKALAETKRVHAHLVRNELEATWPLGEYMLSALVKCGDLEDALQIFNKLPQRTVASWTAVIDGYSKAGKAKEAVRMYYCMREEDLEPSTYTIVSLIKACGSISDLEGGRRIHAEAVSFGYGSELFVGTCLVEMYAKCGSMVEAEHVFYGLSLYDLFLCNAMLAAYVSHGQANRALQMYEQMLEKGISPDIQTFVSTLQACHILAKQEIHVFVDGRRVKANLLGKAKAIHANAWISGYKSNVVMCTTLVSLYSKCGSIVDAQEVFDRLSNRDVVTWNAMLAAYAQQGQAEEALLLYGQLLEEGLSSDGRTFVSALQACGMLAEKKDASDLSSKLKSLAIGKEIHADARRKGYDTHVFVGNSLLSTYGKSGNIVDAQYVFDGLSQRNVVTWNVMLAALAQQGHEDKALELYSQMLAEGMIPSHRTLASTIQACASLSEEEDPVVFDGQMIKANALEKGKALHFEAWRRGYKTDVFIGSTLVKMYANCGSILDAQKVFHELSQWNVVSCNTMLAAYAVEGRAEKSLQLYRQMLKGGVSPDVRTFVAVLQACGMLAYDEEAVLLDGQLTKLKSLERGKAIHFQAWKNGYASDVFIGSTLISMYSKCGSIVSAQQVFDVLHQRNVVSWNAMLGAYAEQGKSKKVLQLYEQMMHEGVHPNIRSFVYAFQACGVLLENEGVVGDGHVPKMKVLEIGKTLHSDAWRKGYLSDVFLSNTMLSMYAKCGSIDDAQHVFDGLSEHNVVSWTAMLRAYVKQGQGEKSLQLYEQMIEEGVNPNNWTFVSALQACGLISQQGAYDVSDGRETKVHVLGKARVIHAEAWKMDLESDVFINSTLFTIYTECGSIVDGQHIFDRLCERDVVSWNAMLTAYAQQGQAEEALHLYEQMLEEGVSPDVRTFVSVLQACSMLIENEEDGIVDSRFAQIGKMVHAEAWERDYRSNLFVCSSLIHMYGKSESVVAAETVFDGMSERNVVAWNAMLGAYAQQGQTDKAFQLFNRMLKEAVCPNEVTFICMLQACSTGGNLDICTQIHHKLVSGQIGMSPLLASSLIHAYGRCASMADAQNVFNGLLNPNVVSWTALIAGYAYQGNCKASLHLYEEMLLKGMKPDGVTFLSVLSVCTHAGLVDQGLKYFESMSREHGISPDIEHYVSMVDLLGRAGSFAGIKDLLSAMPMQPNLSMWLCLLSACRKYGHVELARLAFDCAVHLQPKNAAAFCVMSSTYAQASLWDCAKEVNELRETAGAWKVPAKSWIAHEQQVHTFLVGDHRHPLHAELYDLLATLNTEKVVKGTSSHVVLSL